VGESVEPVERISAVTLKTSDMSRSFDFYAALGFRRLYGGRKAEFTSFGIGTGFLNLQLDRDYWPQPIWGRVVFWVDDVDAMFARAVAAGHQPSSHPLDAPWGERYFHITDPDGHELSFAKPL
jgi:catechol 2,3-dioxygenase-like lactoylglutathione lyase family enzyme